MKHILVTGILLVMVFCHRPVEAQINESDTVALQIRSSLGGMYQKGNVELLVLRGRLDVLIAPAKDWVLKSQNVSLYQAFYSKKADNDLLSRNFVYYKPTRRVYPYGMAFISGNFRRKIDWRYYAGAGLSWQLVRTRKNVLKLSANGLYEQTRFSAADYNFERYDGLENIRLWRATAYLSGWHFLADNHVRLYYDAFWMPGIDHDDNYRAQIDLGLDFLLWKGLSFNVLYSFQQEQVVAAGIRQQDRILTFGLAYNLRKQR